MAVATGLCVALHALTGLPVLHLFVAFAPGGRLVATAGADLTVSVFPLGGGGFSHRTPSELKRHEGAVTCLAFAPAEAGGGLASGSVDGTIALWRRVHEDTDATDSDA